MRYLFIDHITEWKSGELIKGIKSIAMSEDFLEFHFPKNPIMPGVLLLEALAQLTGWLEAASSDFKNWFLINKVRKSSFYGFALPGDQVELEVQVISNEDYPYPYPLPDKSGEGAMGRPGDVFLNEKPTIKIYKGMGTVKGKKKITTEFEGEIVPFADMEDTEEQKRFFQVLIRGPNL